MRVAVMVAWLAGCVVVKPPELRERPRWRLAGDASYDAGCAHAAAFVRKSGKQGFALALQIRSRGDCSFAIAASHLAFAHGATVTTRSLPTIALRGRSLIYAWLPVEFDNDDAWNDHLDDATLELAVTVAGQPAPAWRIAVVQR